jgi:hypothetical protein
VPVQADPVAHPAFCTIGSGSFPGVKRPGLSDDRPNTSSAEVKEKVHEVTLTYAYTYIYTQYKEALFFPPWLDSLSGPGLLNFRGFTFTLRHITFGRTPLDE